VNHHEGHEEHEERAKKLVRASFFVLFVAFVVIPSASGNPWLKRRLVAASPR